MESIFMDEELSRYNLDGKWNDYIGVQKEVLDVLRVEKGFTYGEIINKQTGMCIRINAKGIKETLGPGKRFQALPKRLKQYKIATLVHLRSIIENAELIMDKVPNYHYKNQDTFAYFESQMEINQELVSVRITVKKKISSNWFWMHNINEMKKVPNYSTHLLDGIKRDSELLS